jgi:hypothetical protein
MRKHAGRVRAACRIAAGLARSLTLAAQLRRFAFRVRLRGAGGRFIFFCGYAALCLSAAAFERTANALCAFQAWKNSGGLKSGSETQWLCPVIS